MKAILIVPFILAACSYKKSTNDYPDFTTGDTTKANRILSLINGKESIAEPNQVTLSDTIVVNYEMKEPTIYTAVFDSSRHLQYIRKEQYLDTIKTVKFDFNNDSLLFIDYQGTLTEKPHTHWYGMYFLENDKVFLQLNSVIKNLRLEGEIADAYTKRDFFYKKLNKDTGFDSSQWHGIKKIEDDTNLVLPRLKFPSNFCDLLKANWDSYLNANPEMIVKLNLDDETVDSHFSEIVFDIDEKGIVTDYKIHKGDIELSRSYVNAFKSSINESKWTPAYKKSKNGKSYIKTTVSAYFEVVNRKLQSVQLTSGTGPFYECK